MKKRFTILAAAFALLAFLAIPMGMRGQEVTLDFTNNTWGLPEGSSNGQTTSASFTDSQTGLAIALEATTKYYFHTDGYLLFGKANSKLTLPAFSFAVERIEVVGRSGASSSVKQNIYVGEEAVSTETTGATGTNTYSITTDYQAAGNIYVLKVTSNHNTQVTSIKVYEVGGTQPTTYTVTFDAGQGTFVGSNNLPNTSNTVTAGTYTLPTATRDGYTFDGWMIADDAELYNGSYSVSGNVDFTAAYTESIPPTPGVNDYTLFSGNLEEGDYVIYYDGKAMKNTVANNRLQYSEVTPSNNIISNPDASIIWHIAPSGDYWTIYSAAVNKYAAGTGIKNQAGLLNDGSDDKSLWTASGTSTYEFVNKAHAASSINANLRNNGTYGFACYATATGGALTLYKAPTSSVATPTFSPASGTEFGNEGLQVTITCTTAGVDIYYTLDGSEPDDESNPYNGPISLTETTTIKAIAYDGDDNNSAVATATYTYVDPNAPGTENNPYTVAQARAAIDANAGTQGVYATGIVSAIPTAYSSQHSNITFNMIDEEGDEDFLQAYRCSGEEAANVAVGDVVLVYGDLTLYTNSNTGVTTYEFAQGCTLISLTHPTGYVEAPTFSPAAGTYDEAQNVTIECANANATIYYTLDGTDPTNASTPYTTAINIATTTTIKAIAYVDANASAVTTAEYTIVPVANISSITEVGTPYVVKGTVVATNSRGFVMGDGTGYVYYYKNGTVSQSIGDMVKVSGTTGTYGQIIQFTNTATVTEATTSNYNGTPAATVITEVPDYTSGYHLSTYFEFEGELTKSNNSYFIALGEEQIQISYPTSAQGTALTALDGKTVHVKGYFAGINSSSKFTVMLESAEEVVSTEPVINADDITLTYDATSGEIEYTITNPVEGTVLYATCDAEWVSNIVVGESSITFNVTENEGTEDRTATFTLTYAGAEDKTVTVTQGHFVVDYAILRFEFDGGRADIANTNGLTQENIGTDYSSSPKLRFEKGNKDNDGLYSTLILKFNERPGKLTFDIKGNGFSGGTFKVQTSEDGVTYTDMATYTDLTATVQSEEFNNLGENVRYIKWIYTEKVNGNVALGNIVLEKYTEPEPTITITDATLNLSAEAHEGNIEVTYQNINDITASVYFCDANGGEASYDWITASINAENNVEYTISGNDGEARTAYLKVNVGETYSNLVTINQAAYVAPPTGAEYVLYTGELVEGDYVICYHNTTWTAAMKNTVESGRLAYEEVIPENDVVITDDATIVWHIAQNGEYWTIYSADANAYAAGTGVKNKAQMLEDVTDYALWSVSGTDAYDFVNKGNAADNVNAYLRNNTIYGFACYAQDMGGALSLYKKVDTQTVTQTIELTEGWNNISIYLDIADEDEAIAMLGQLEEALGENALSIEGTQGYTTYEDEEWYGSLDNVGLTNDQSYTILVTTACTIELEGSMYADPDEHPITINPGWNNIGFPYSSEVDVEVALGDFEAEELDMVEGPVGSGYTTYEDEEWYGALATFVPGQGYKYLSNSTEPKRLFIQTGAEKTRLAKPALGNVQKKNVFMTGKCKSMYGNQFKPVK